MKIAVCVHLYHPDMWGEIQNYLNNLKYDYNLYVNLPYQTDGSIPSNFEWETYINSYDDLKVGNKNTYEKAIEHYKKHGYRESRLYSKEQFDVVEKIKKYKSDSNIIISPNKGLDLGGFLYTYKHIDLDTDLILKIHTKKGMGSKETPSREIEVNGFDKAVKKGKKWFKALMDGVLMSKNQVDNIINNFKINEKLGMVGYHKSNNFSLNYFEMEKLFEYFGMSGVQSNFSFIGGTIFWCRNSILNKYLTNQTIDILLDRMPYGYVVEPSINHAMERILGCIVYVENKDIQVIG